MSRLLLALTQMKRKVVAITIIAGSSCATIVVNGVVSSRRAAMANSATTPFGSVIFAIASSRGFSGASHR